METKLSSTVSASFWITLALPPPVFSTAMTLAGLRASKSATGATRGLGAAPAAGAAGVDALGADLEAAGFGAAALGAAGFCAAPIARTPAAIRAVVFQNMMEG